MQEAASTRNKIFANNKEGLYNYEVVERFEAGIVLKGAEVKSVKGGRVSIKGSYIRIDANGEAWIINCNIAAYGPAKGNLQNYIPDKPRKLLLHKKELTSLIGKNKQKGLTIIPTCVYTKKGLIKVEIALARGKTMIDKREQIKKREAERQIKRTLKQK
ncbi:MAG: SsrA-binding protein SmpB [Candidatus Buchananbacteria bacterium]